jgi:hypothetical protein
VAGIFLLPSPVTKLQLGLKRFEVEEKKEKRVVKGAFFLAMEKQKQNRKEKVSKKFSTHLSKAMNRSGGKKRRRNLENTKTL